VLVTNHALLARDVAQRVRGHDGLWPQPSLAIVDEADFFLEFLRRELAGSLSVLGCREAIRLAKRLSRVVSQPGHDLVGALDELREVLDEAVRVSVVRASDEATLIPVDPSVIGKLGQALRSARVEAEVASPALAMQDEYDRAASDLADVLDNIGRLAEHFEVARRSPRSVAWIQSGGSRAAVPLCAGPTVLRDALRHLGPAVFTAGTLAPASDFSLFTGALGVDRAAQFYAPSPFDYPAQMRYTIDFRLPDPRDFQNLDRTPLYRAWTDALVPLLRAAGGRALILFTSRRDLAEVTGMVRAEALPFAIHSDIDGAPAELAAKFKADPTSVYLSTAAWNGLDVPGLGLILVVIMKLPYPVPQDPLATAQQRLFKETMQLSESDFTLRWMLQRLAQGVGRLIRSETDQGVVALLDPRTLERWDAIRPALPDAPVVPPVDARAFLESLGRTPAQSNMT
jgi:ATP-dependent DNA helicase DinG